VSASGSRPAYVDEFERKLAAALARQADTKKTRLAPIRSLEVDLSASSSPSLGEALTRSSTREDTERPLNVAARQPASETRKGRTPTHKAATVSVRYDDTAIAVGAGTTSLTDGSGAVGASQPAGELSRRTTFESTLELSDVAAPATEQVAPPADPATDASCADHPSQPARRAEELIGVPAEIGETAAVAAEVLQAFADSFAQGGGNRPEEGIAAVEALVSEAARPIEAANFREHETRLTDATKRGSRGWRFKALAVTLSVAMVGAVFMRVGGMLAPASETPGAAGPNLGENVTSDQGAAEQAPSDEAPSASSAGSDLLKDRPEVNSAAVVAAPTAPLAAKTAVVNAIQPPGGLLTETPPASIVNTSGAAPPAAPPMAQSFDVKPVSPQPTLVTDSIQSAALPTKGLSQGRAPEPTAEPTRNEHGVGTTKPLAPERDAPIKIADKPSTRAVITKNHLTSHPVAVRMPSQPLPHGTSAKHDNSAKEEPTAQAAVESAAAAATPAASLQPGGLY
jgi:hypothetical protein